MVISEIHEVEKHIQSRLGKRISTPKRLLRGTFKENDSEILKEGDEFMAYPVGKGDAMETYNAYISYFNYTSMDVTERKRIAVKAEWVDIK